MSAWNAWTEHSEAQGRGPVQIAKDLADEAEAFGNGVKDNVEGQWNPFNPEFWDA